MRPPPPPPSPPPPPPPSPPPPPPLALHVSMHAWRALQPALSLKHLIVAAQHDASSLMHVLHVVSSNARFAFPRQVCAFASACSFVVFGLVVFPPSAASSS